MKYNVIRTTSRTPSHHALHPGYRCQGSGPPAPNADEAKARSRIDWLPYAIIAVLLCVLYYRVAIKLVYDWYTIPDYSHGFLVPFFAAFLIWDKRKVLSTTPVKPTWSGLVLVLFAIAVLILGVYGVELFTARMSFVFLLAGLIWTFSAGRWCAHFAFLFWFSFWPSHFPPSFSTRSPSRCSCWLPESPVTILPLLGVPILHEGNVIELPVMKLEVAEACSGIRSLMSLFTLAVFYGYFLERTTKRRVILALASIPIAVAANVVRIVGTGLCVQYWDPDKASASSTSSQAGSCLSSRSPASIWFTAPCGSSPP